ncbi:MAG TPA: Rieske 2Fe-2S domain-containing protein [Candidatus Methylomirabilis sp.]|nr:Rieske 2Fe-2S domain-containing protein [Candidatus Methylomirabilis sp.]
MATFVKVGRVSDFSEGQVKVVQANGQRIALFHVGGRFYALEAACPHEGEALADGTIEGLRVLCPWHGYDFHLKTGECELDPDLHALTYPVKVHGKEILIEMA